MAPTATPAAQPAPAASTPEASFLQVKHVTKLFGSFKALDDVSLDVRHGEFVSILGPSGCGKTTLLRVIAGLEEHNAGQLLLQGSDVSRLPVAKRKCGIVFQSYALFPNLTARQNIIYGIARKGMTRQQLNARVDELLEMVGLGDIGYKYPAQMSGGQQQRVALARALAPSPALLLLDEPLSALDARVRIKLRAEVRRIQQALGVTTIMVTHDQEEALTMADRIVVMNEGRLMQYDTPQAIYHGPTDPFVAGFIGSMNFLRDWQAQEDGRVISGKVALELPGDKLARYVGKPTTLAIRPEDIRIVTNGGAPGNVLATEVEYIEFRGSFYRVRLRVNDAEKGSRAEFLEVDMQSEIVDEHKLEQGSNISIQLPAERIHIFGELLHKALG
jgi:iron(III) transport system ATP-binding protein